MVRGVAVELVYLLFCDGAFTRPRPKELFMPYGEILKQMTSRWSASRARFTRSCARPGEGLAARKSIGREDPAGAVHTPLSVRQLA